MNTKEVLDKLDSLYKTIRDQHEIIVYLRRQLETLQQKEQKSQVIKNEVVSVGNHRCHEGKDEDTKGGDPNGMQD